MEDSLPAFSIDSGNQGSIAWLFQLISSELWLIPDGFSADVTLHEVRSVHSIVHKYVYLIRSILLYLILNFIILVRINTFHIDNHPTLS